MSATVCLAKLLSRYRTDLGEVYRVNFIEALNWRYAVKQFSDRKIPQSQLRELLEATRLSASAYGLQPYQLLVVEADSVKARLCEYAYGQEKVRFCSHLVVFASQARIDEQLVERYMRRYGELHPLSDDERTRLRTALTSALLGMSAAEKQEWARQQAYLGLGNLLTCAAQSRIDSCPMAGFEPQGFDKVLGLKQQGLTSTVICALGYRHENDTYAHRPRIRQDYDAFVQVV